MAAERQQAALVACYEIVGLTGFRQGQQKVIRGIGGAFHAWQRVYSFGEPSDLVDQAAGLVWFDEFGHPWLLQRGAQLIEMCRAGQERKFSVQPGSRIAAALPAGVISPETRMLVSRTTRIRLCRPFV